MRTLVHEVVADLDDVASEIVLDIHWVGGVHTELRLPKRRRGQRNATPDDIVEAVRQLVLIANDDVIAGALNRNGLTTGNGNRWTRERVTALRSYRRIPVFRPQIDGFEPWLNLGGAAKLLGVTPKTLRLAAEAGEIEGPIHCPRVHGSSAVQNSRPQKRVRSLIAPGRTRGTHRIASKSGKLIPFNNIERWAL